MMTRRKGFTLLEILVVASIALIIFGVGIMAISGTIAARRASLSRIRSTENARLFFQTLERDLAGAYPMFTIGNKDSMRFTYTLGSGIQTDCIQFYTRIDRPNALDDYVFVRYYVNNSQELCRQVLKFSTLNDISALLTAPPAMPPLNDESNAVFDTARSMVVYFRQWDPDNKVYVAPYTLSSTADNPNHQVCTHLQVKLLITDNAGQQGEAQQTQFQSATRAYVNVFAIPTAFKN